MSRPMQASAKRPRISVDVGADVRRRLRLAAATKDVSVGRYVLDAIERQIAEDLRDFDDGASRLTAESDPVLAALWDNPRDAEYDRL